MPNQPNNQSDSPPSRKKLPARVFQSRRKMDDTRQSIVHEFEIGGRQGFLNVGFFDDGSPGEIFIHMDREGSTLGGMVDAVAALTSYALQYGAPLEALVHKFAWQKFEPSGHVDHEQIKYAHSILDYVFRWLGYAFIPNFAEHADAQDKSLR